MYLACVREFNFVRLLNCIFFAFFGVLVLYGSSVYATSYTSYWKNDTVDFPDFSDLVEQYDYYDEKSVIIAKGKTTFYLFISEHSPYNYNGASIYLPYIDSFVINNNFTLNPRGCITYKLSNNSWVLSDKYYQYFQTLSGLTDVYYTNYDIYSVVKSTNQYSIAFSKTAPLEPDYTDVSGVGDTYYLLKGSRYISADTPSVPVYLYCNKILAEYNYILVYYSDYVHTGRDGVEQHDGYQLDFFFANYPFYIEKDVGFSGGNKTSTIHNDTDTNYYHLELKSDYFNNETTNFNLVDFDIDKFTPYTKETSLEHGRYNPSNIIYCNYGIKIQEADGSYTRTPDEQGVLYLPEETPPSTDGSVKDTLDNLNDQFPDDGSEPDTNTNTDVSEYIKPDSDDDIDFDTNKGGQTITDAFKKLFQLFNFSDSLTNTFKDVNNFIFEQKEAPVLYYYYYKDGEVKAITKVASHSTGGFSGDGRSSKMGYGVANSVDSVNATDENMVAVPILDLSWYAPYKPICDIIITAYCYIYFIWHLLRNLPAIIHGDVSSPDNIN